MTARARFGACCLALLLSCAPENTPVKAPRVVPAAAPVSYQVAITGDIGGQLRPVRGAGGLARQVEAVRAAQVVLDAGDRFFRGYRVAQSDQPRALAAAEVLALGLAQSQARAMAVGERDLALGLPALRRLGRAAGVELLSVNLRHAETGTAAFEAFVVLDVQGQRLGVVAASAVFDAQDPQGEAYTWAGLRAVAPGPALQRAVANARKQGASVVLGLLHMPLPQAQGLLQAHDLDLDYVVLAHDRGPSKAGPGLATLSDRNRTQVMLQVMGDDIRASTATITQEFAEDDTVTDAVTQVLGARRRLRSTLVGPKTCAKTCHLDALRHWKKTRHARSWSGLVKERQTRNQDCVACHATSLAVSRPKSVSCESCHGDLRAHREAPADVRAGPVAKTVCGECHRAQAEQRPFVHDVWWPKVLGAGHGLSAQP